MNDLELLSQFASKLSSNGEAISPISEAPWVDVIEARLGFKLPRLYRLLLQSYSFTPFRASGVEFYGNIGDSKDCDDISQRIFSDRALADSLVPKRMVHFAAPVDGSYDPVCINLFRPGTSDGPIVRIDHEDILCHFKVTIVQELFPSFKALVQATLEACYESQSELKK